MTRLIVLALSLALTTPAFALNYTGTASFDWAALTFSGIPVTIEPEHIDLHAVELSGRGETFSDYQSTPMDVAIPGIGRGMTDVTDTQFLASITLNSEGTALSQALHETFFAVTQSGDLTVSIPYHLTQTDGPLTASSLAEMTLGHYENAQTSQTVLNTLNTDRTGTLSVTHYFTLGESGFLNAFLLTTATAPQGSSVPVPDLFWPSLFTMLVLAWALLRRRHGRGGR